MFQSTEKPITEINAWAEFPESDMPKLFDRFFEKKKGIENQYHRLSAIRFGVVESKAPIDDNSNESFYKAVIAANSMTIHMAVSTLKSSHGSSGEADLSHFNLIVEVVRDKTQSLYFKAAEVIAISDSPLKEGLVYGPSRSPEKSNEQTLDLQGIRSITKNHLCADWCWANSNELSTLFTALAPNLEGLNSADFCYHHLTQKSEASLVPDFRQALLEAKSIVYDPFNRSNVRGLSYVVEGYSFNVFKQNLKETSCFTIHLGLNRAGELYNKDQFSLILEILDSKGSKPARVKTKFNDSVTNEGEDYVITTDVPGPELLVPGIKLPSIGDTCDAWVNNNTRQGLLRFNLDSSELGEIESLVFTEYESIFDDFLHPCPPFCGGGDGGN